MQNLSRSEDPQDTLLLVSEVSIKVLGFAHPYPMQADPPNEGSLMWCLCLQSSLWS